MVVATMDGPTRDQVLRFMRTKDHIELEIQELTAVLESQHVGMSEPLVDADGFPRTDIDVYKVRHARHRIICLQNDHKAIMKHIERGLHLLHSKASGQSASNTAISPSSGNIEPMDTDQSVQTDDRMSGVVEAANNMRLAEIKAIARVNFVSAGSPADNACVCSLSTYVVYGCVICVYVIRSTVRCSIKGIRVDDEILEFGSVNASNFTALTQIGDVVSHSVASPVNVKLRRGGEIINVTLVPNVWAGRGLLGCNIVAA